MIIKKEITYHLVIEGKVHLGGEVSKALRIRYMPSTYTKKRRAKRS